MTDWLTAMREVSQGSLSSVYVLVGTEYALMRRFTQAISQRLTLEAGETVEVNRFSFEEDGPDAAVAACQTVSLFGAVGVQVLDNCWPLLASGKGKGGQRTDGLEHYLEQPINGHVLVLTAYGPKMDDRKRLVKLAKQYAIVDCTTPKEPSALSILCDLAASSGIKVSTDALSELLRRTVSVSQALSDLDKLGVYALGREVQVADVAVLVPARLEDNIFHWVDHAVRGEVGTALRTLDELLLAGNDLFAMISLLGRQWRLIWHSQWAEQHRENPKDVAVRVGAHPFALKVAAEQGRGLCQRTVEDLLVQVADVELELKTGKRDPRQAMEWLVLSFAAARESRLARAK